MKKKIIIIMITTLISMSCFIAKTNASTITTSSDQYLVQTCSGPGVCDYTLGGSTYNTGYINRNTQFENIHGPSGASQFVSAIRFRQQFSSANYLQNGVQYTIRYKVNIDSKLYSYRKPTTKWTEVFSIVNSSGNSQDIPATDYVIQYSDITNDTYGFYITITYTPSTTIKQISLQLRFPYSDTATLQGNTTTLYQEQLWALNYKTLSISANNDAVDAINNQTIVIENKIQEVIESINIDHIFNNTPSDNTQDNLNLIEGGIYSQLDTSEVSNLDITINTDSSNFIWYVMGKLRSINAKIIVLMTSILGLGIIKVILNR